MHSNYINYLIVVIILLVVLLIYYILEANKKLDKIAVLAKNKDSSSSNTLQSLKLQACERFMLLTERIDPINLLTRIKPIDKNAQSYRLLLINTIQDEYNYNIAWQLYLNDTLALNLKHLVGDTILTINIATENLPNNASAIDLSKNIISKHTQIQNSIYFQFQSSLRKYVKKNSSIF